MQLNSAFVVHYARTERKKRRKKQKKKKEEEKKEWKKEKHRKKLRENERETEKTSCAQVQSIAFCNFPNKPMAAELFFVHANQIVVM